MTPAAQPQTGPMPESGRIAGQRNSAAPGPLASPRPRLLVLTVGFTIGGAEQLILLTAPRLSRAGFDVTVACLKGWGPLGDELQAAGIRAVALGGAGPWDLRVAGRLISLLRRERTRILHAHLFRANLAARLIGRLAGIPVIVTSHHDTDVWMGLRHRLLERLTAPMSDAVTACSEAVRQYALATYGLRTGLVRTISNAIAVTGGERDAVQRERTRRALGAAPGELVVGTVGRLDEPKKGLSTFLKAAGLLARNVQEPGIRFVIVGEGPARVALEAAAVRQGIADRTVFTGSRRDVADLMQGFDLFVQPSLWEGFGITLLEAMAASLPVVASSVGGIPEVVIDGETGLLAAPGDAPDLARQCGVLLHDRALAERMGRAGRQRVIERFGIERLVGETVTLYHELLDRVATDRGPAGRPARRTM